MDFQEKELNILRQAVDKIEFFSFALYSSKVF